MMFNHVFSGKTVLVTGHTGFKGSWLSQWLVNLGAKVVGYSYDIPTKPSHFELINLRENLESIEGDIRDYKAFQKTLKTHRPDIVFHLAAQSLVGKSVTNPLETIETNVLGTANVLDAITKAGTTEAAVIITSDKCYENKEWEFGYRENDQLGGKDPYSASKACAEVVFSSFFRSFISRESIYAATARAGNVIGGGDWAQHRIVPDCVRSWSENNPAEIRSPSSTRPWQHVLEPLSGYLHLGSQLLLKNEKINGKSFNFGPPSDTVQSVKELVDEAKKTWPDSSWNSGEDLLKNKEANLLRLNCDRALSLLGWKPTLSFKESANMTFNWYSMFYNQSQEQAEAYTNNDINEYVELAKVRHAVWTVNE